MAVDDKPVFIQGHRAEESPDGDEGLTRKPARPSSAPARWSPRVPRRESLPANERRANSTRGTGPDPSLQVSRAAGKGREKPLQRRRSAADVQGRRF